MIRAEDGICFLSAPQLPPRPRPPSPSAARSAGVLRDLFRRGAATPARAQERPQTGLVAPHERADVVVGIGSRQVLRSHRLQGLHGAVFPAQRPGYAGNSGNRCAWVIQPAWPPPPRSRSRPPRQVHFRYRAASLAATRCDSGDRVIAPGHAWTITQMNSPAARTRPRNHASSSSSVCSTVAGRRATRSKSWTAA